MELGRRQFLQTVTVGGFGLLAPGFHQLVAAAETASWFPNPLVLPPLEEGRLIDEDHSITCFSDIGQDQTSIEFRDP